MRKAISRWYNGGMANRPKTVMAQAREDILPYLAKGMTRRAASAMVGIDEHTIRDWERTDPQYAQRIHAAESLARAVMEERVFAASQDDWRAAAWYLERRDRENWGKQVAVENTGELRVTIVRKGKGDPAE